MGARLAVLLAGSMLALVASCAPDTTVEGASAELRESAAALTEQPGIHVTYASFDVDGIRRWSTWEDVRANGDRRGATTLWLSPNEERDEPGLGITAYVQVDEEVYVAAQRPGESLDWEQRPLDPFPVGQVGQLLDLTDLSPELDPAEPHDPDTDREVVSVERTARDGAVTWTVELALYQAGTDRQLPSELVYEWTTRDGLLATYQVSGSGPFYPFGGSPLRWELTPVDDPGPITPPEVGTPLDLAGLGVPDDFPLAGPER